MLELRPFQKEALEALARPGHVLCVAPTGSGKSLIYERAAQRPGRRTLLITPLVALARQQQRRLGGAPRAMREAPVGETGIWIVSPERLQFAGSDDHLRRWGPDFLVVDECHCLWEWGESFRPAFRLIPPLLRRLRIASSLWLTATLPPEARVELRESLAPARLLELGAFDLPERLELRVARVPWAERSEALLGWILQQREPGIAFAPSRESTERLARLLRAAGREAVAYHAGLSSEERRAVESRISERAPQVVVATSAFGMGMDCAALRWAALWQAPPSLLALAQAIGRIGRGPGGVGRALVLWDCEDFVIQEWTLGESERRKRQLALVRGYLAGHHCRRAALRAYFDPGLPSARGCGACDFCFAGGGGAAAGSRSGLRVGSDAGEGGPVSVQMLMT